MCENVNYLHLILSFWVFTSSVGDFNYFIYILNICFKFWACQPTKNRFYTHFEYFENNNYFKLHKITCFIKWHFCNYPRVRGVTIFLSVPPYIRADCFSIGANLTEKWIVFFSVPTLPSTRIVFVLGVDLTSQIIEGRESWTGGPLTSLIGKP